MGYPLAPVLAKISMAFYKCKWLNEFNLNKPKFYLRYVDDILAAFDNEQDSLNFLNFLNKVIILKYFDYKCSCDQNQLKDKSDVHYF